MARKWIILILAAVMTITTVIMLNINPAAQVGLPVIHPEAEQLVANAMLEVAAEAVAAEAPGLVFSHTEHFYDYDIYVEIIASHPDAVIYYTTDGAEPTEESTKYTRPLHFSVPVPESIEVVPLKAIAVHEEKLSRPLVHTYFLGEDINNRFDVIVFSLSTNEEHLYDYETGIFVEGRTREIFIRENPREHITPPKPANFNWRGMEGERPVYVEVFTEDGTRAVSQAAGIRVHGGWSRAAEYKSIRLVPRRMYESDSGRFRFDFFPDDVVRNDYGTPILRYDQMILRNGANDRDFGMLRNEVGYALAHMAGLSMVSPVRGAAIFLNGEYYGFTWLQVRVNAQYLQEAYSAPTRDFQIVGMGELWIDSENEHEIEAINHFNSFADKDLTDDKVFSELTELVDVDELLLYYGLQIYLGNHDWPHNNLKRWRYTGPQVEGLAPELDGRWRYIVFDLDWILGLYEEDANPDRPTFQAVLTENADPERSRYSHLLSSILKRPDMADRFAMILCDIAANIATEENVGRQIDRLYGEAYNELGAALSSRKYAGWVSRGSIDFNHANMLRVARNRDLYIFRSLREFFNWDNDMFTVEVTGGEAIIGTQTGTSSTYFSHMTIPVKPVLPKFTVFDHWLVNGSVVYTPEITVSANNANYGVVWIELVTREEFPALMFTEAYGSSARNGCTLYNPGDEIVDTVGLYITNDISNPFLWPLPSTSVRPGGTLEMAGRGSADATDIHKIRMGFNVREGRMLYLCDEEGNVLDTMVVVSEPSL